MDRFTTEQLKDALIGLHSKTDADSEAAFQMTFDEVCNRIGEDAFDAWCEVNGW